MTLSKYRQDILFGSMDKNEILKQVRKEYGDNSIFTTNDHIVKPIDVISTGSFILDYQVLGIGGFPRGRSTMISGAEGSGKTTVSLHTAANAQAQNLLVAFIDAEQKLDLSYATALGVNTDDMLIVQPPHLHDSLGIMDLLCRQSEVGLIIFDSVVALGTLNEYKEDNYSEIKDFGATRAKEINTFFRRNIYNIRKHNIALIVINQLRDNISTTGFSRKKTYVPGGRALKHYASILLELSYTGRIKEGENIIGETVKAFTPKNNVALSFKSSIINIYSGQGIDSLGDIVTAASDLGVINKRGAWYFYDNQTIGQGLRLTTEALKNDKLLLNTITQETKEKWLNGQ